MTIILCILAAAIAGTVGFFVGKDQGTLEELARCIRKSAEFDFSSDNELEGLMNKGGGAGEIARSLHILNENMVKLASDIRQAAQGISSDVTQLYDLTNRVNEDSSDNSATSQELAAAMEETAASTQTISEAVRSVHSDCDEINKVTAEGLVVTGEIQAKAQKLEFDVADMRSETNRLYMEVRERSRIALEQSKAVEKINDMAKAIMDIASQTSLLALNASIEAARAGEEGRGFAVVAEEIGKLAGQSSETVSGITAIVKDVHSAVDNMSECLSTLNSFLEDKVEKDYDKFIDVSQQYNNDAHVFQVSLQDIHYLVEDLNRTLDEVSTNLDSINTTVGESALGVTDIAQKTTDVVGITARNLDLVGKSAKTAENLELAAGRFKI